MIAEFENGALIFFEVGSGEGVFKNKTTILSAVCKQHRPDDASQINIFVV